MVKALVFDYFGVICSDEYWRFVKEDKNMQGVFHNLSNAVNVGSLHWHDFINKVAQKTGADPASIQNLYETESINLHLISYIDELHKTYKTALLTNGHFEFLEPRLEATQLNSIFDTVIISSRLGLVKPDPKIYEHTLKTLGVEAREAVLIDDISRNVSGAETIGMHAILYQDFSQLQQELSTLLANTNH